MIIAKVTKVNPNSAFADLLEYPGLEGMIHISEIARGWVRDIRQHVKANQEIVAVVIKSEPLSLSLKRLNPNQRSSKLKEWGSEKRAEKMLEMTAKKLDKTLDQAYEEMGFDAQERLGTTFEIFKTAVTKPEKLKGLIPAEWFDPVLEIAEKSIEKKEFEFKATLILRAPGSDGINEIKDFVKKAEKTKLDIHYIASPNYLVKYRTTDPKKGFREFQEKLEKLVKGAKIEASYELEE